MGEKNLGADVLDGSDAGYVENTNWGGFKFRTLRLDEAAIRENGWGDWFKDKTANRVDVYQYRYQPNEVTGIIFDENSNCHAMVEYTYEQTDKAPWADKYLEITDKNRTWKACFMQYDDGWRIK